MPIYSELITKLARQEKLTGLEIEQLRQESKALEDVSHFVKSFQGYGKILSRFIDFPIEPIYSNILEQDLATLTVSIPSTYKHLFFMGAGRTTGAGTSSQYLRCQFNGDTGANYESEIFHANNTTLTGTKETGATRLTAGLLSEGGTAAGFVSSFFTVIPHYSTDYDKNVLSLMMVGGIVFAIGARWDTAEPIHKMTLFSTADDIAAGAAISIYGVR